MIIRTLERSDFKEIYNLLQDFARETGLGNLQQKQNYDYNHINGILLKCLYSGVNFVAEKDNTCKGFILSLRVPDVWTPNNLYLRELAWFIDKDYRSTTIGARLFHSYKKTAEKLYNKGEIAGFTISKLANSPDFDYEKRGFKYIESTYMIGD